MSFDLAVMRCRTLAKTIEECELVMSHLEKYAATQQNAKYVRERLRISRDNAEREYHRILENDLNITLL